MLRILFPVRKGRVLMPQRDDGPLLHALCPGIAVQRQRDMSHAQQDFSQVPLWCVHVPGKMTGCTGTSVACTGAEDRLNRRLCGVRRSSSLLST